MYNLWAWRVSPGFQYAGASYRVAIRGVEQRAIFDDDDDRNRFLLRPGEAAGEWLRMGTGAAVIEQLQRLRLRAERDTESAAKLTALSINLERLGLITQS